MITAKQAHELMDAQKRSGNLKVEALADLRAEAGDLPAQTIAGYDRVQNSFYLRMPGDKENTYLQHWSILK